MRIAVISDSVMPTPYEFGHGLGRAAHNVAQGLVRKGHDVTLVGAEGSYLNGGTVVAVKRAGSSQEKPLVDAALRCVAEFAIEAAVDMSHSHGFALRSGVPTVAYFEDRASAKAPNAVFVSFDQMNYVNLPGYVVRNGVDFDEYALYDGPREDLIFIGSSIGHKGLNDARAVAKLAGLKLWEYGNGCRDGNPSQGEKIFSLQRAVAAILPYQIDAGPLTPLEAQACGTPVVAFRKCAMPEYVPAGFLGETITELAGLVRMAEGLDPYETRKAVWDAGFSVEDQVRGIENMLFKVLDGERW